MVVNDNFGILIAGLFRFPSALVKTVVMQNKDNNPVNLNVFDTDVGLLFNDTNVAIGVGRVQVGKGLTPATRQDFKIEVPFTNPPENDFVNNTLPSGYNSGLGKISVATLISPTGGAGAITEVTFSHRWSNNGGAPDTFLIFRDVLTVPINFIASQAININHEVFV